MNDLSPPDASAAPTPTVSPSPAEPLESAPAEPSAEVIEDGPPREPPIESAAPAVMPPPLESSAPLEPLSEPVVAAPPQPAPAASDHHHTSGNIEQVMRHS